MKRKEKPCGMPAPYNLAPPPPKSSHGWVMHLLVEDSWADLHDNMLNSNFKNQRFTDRM